MIEIAEAFSDSYAEARARFLQAAAHHGLSVDSRRHPEAGRDGEVLAMGRGSRCFRRWTV